MPKQIDMLAVHDLDKWVQRRIIEVRDLATANQDTTIFYDLMVDVAYRYAKLGVTDKALALLAHAPPAYLRDTLPLRMESDPGLATAATFLHEVVVNEGTVRPDYDTKLPVQGPGLA